MGRIFQSLAIVSLFGANLVSAQNHHQTMGTEYLKAIRDAHGEAAAVQCADPNLKSALQKVILSKGNAKSNLLIHEESLKEFASISKQASVVAWASSVSGVVGSTLGGGLLLSQGAIMAVGGAAKLSGSAGIGQSIIVMISTLGGAAGGAASSTAGAIIGSRKSSTKEFVKLSQEEIQKLDSEPIKASEVAKQVDAYLLRCEEAKKVIYAELEKAQSQLPKKARWWTMGWDDKREIDLMVKQKVAERDLYKKQIEEFDLMERDLRSMCSVL